MNEFLVALEMVFAIFLLIVLAAAGIGIGHIILVFCTECFKYE
jgi:hypothetical protein